jgi:hypothetical protein
LISTSTVLLLPHTESNWRKEKDGMYPDPKTGSIPKCHGSVTLFGNSYLLLPIGTSASSFADLDWIPSQWGPWIRIQRGPWIRIQIQEGKMTNKNEKVSKFDFLNCFCGLKTSPIAWSFFYGGL